jgi:hypothetical protein
MKRSPYTKNNNPARRFWAILVKRFAHLRDKDSLKVFDCLIVKFMTPDTGKGYPKVLSA